MAGRQKAAAGSDPIRFVLDGEIHVVDGVAPTKSVLNFLREDLGRTGTKEGCAEGDCGACTVVLGELDDDRVRFRAVNSCIQFVPTLDGKELITVESLKGADGSLHPVQQALVACHGSQCGFCTPGFVMSLFALYKTRQDALACGNQRCARGQPVPLHGLSADRRRRREDVRLRRGARGPAPALDELLVLERVRPRAHAERA